MNIPAPYFDLALTIDILNPINEWESLQYIAPPLDVEEQLINSVEVMFMSVPKNSNFYQKVILI